MPKWKWNKKEMDVLEEMAFKFPQLREIIPALKKGNPPSEKKKRKKKWRREKRGERKGR